MTARSHTGLSGILSSISVGFISIAAGIILLPFIIATIGAAPYGIWLVLVAISAYLQYSDLGIGSAVVHFSARRRSGGESRSTGQLLSAALIWNSGAALLALLAFSLFGVWYAGPQVDAGVVSDEDATALIIIASCALGTLIFRPFIAILHGAGLLPIDRRNQAIAVAIRLIGTCLVLTLSPTIVGVALVEASAIAVPPILAVGAVFRRRLATLEFSRATFSSTRYLLGYSSRSFGVAAAGALIVQSGTILAGVLLGPGAATSYTAAFRVYSAVRQVISWTMDPFRSMLSRVLVAPDGIQTRSTAFTFLRLVALTAVVSSGAVAFCAPWFVEIWLGPQASDLIAPSLTVLMIGLLLSAFQMPLGLYGDAYGRPGAFLLVQITWLASTLALTFCLAPTLDIVGIAWALSAPLFAVVPLSVWQATRKLNLNAGEWGRDVLKPTLKVVLPGLVVGLGIGPVLDYTGFVGPVALWQTVGFLLVTTVTLWGARRSVRPAAFLRLLREKL